MILQKIKFHLDNENPIILFLNFVINLKILNTWVPY